MKMRITLFPGDGIGPEVLASGVRVLNHLAQKFNHEIEFQERLIGGCCIDKFATAITDEAIETAKQSDAVLLGAVGGPKWDNPNAKVRPEQGLLRLRKELGVFANIRPVKVYPCLTRLSPVKSELLKNVDIIVIRELTGGLYFGEKKRMLVDGHDTAIDVLQYQDFEIERIVELAFRIAKERRRKVTSVDKANVLESSRMWRKIAGEIASRQPDIAYENMLVDTASMRLISRPADFDVIVTENMFGDILTDEASILAGSMGLLPSASLGETSRGLYEPIHGSAPDIAGKGIANPIGTIMSTAMMLRYSFGLEQEAHLIESAVEMCIDQNVLPIDLGGSASTETVTEKIISLI